MVIYLKGLNWKGYFVTIYLSRKYNILMPLHNPEFVSDLEWKLIYVGSAEDDSYDQLLESVLVGPVNVGNYRFVFQVVLMTPSTVF